MTVRRLLTLGPNNEPLRVRLYVHPIGDCWAARLVGDDAPPPGRGTLTGLTFFGATPQEAEQEAKACVVLSESAN
jgi:hypothetical protein